VETKGFTPMLILPKVTTQARQASRPSATSIRNEPPRSVLAKKEPRRRRQKLSLLAVDIPIFDEEIAAI
jgi:hypothetical protein